MKAGGPEFKSLVPILKLAQLQVPVTPVLGVGNEHMPGACWLVNLTKQGASHRGRHFTASPTSSQHHVCIHVHIYRLGCKCWGEAWEKQLVSVSFGSQMLWRGEGLLHTVQSGFPDQDSGHLEPRPGIWRDEPCFPQPCFLTPTLSMWEVWLASAPRLGHCPQAVSSFHSHPNNYRRRELMLSACHPVPSGWFLLGYFLSTSRPTLALRKHLTTNHPTLTWRSFPWRGRTAL